MTQHFNITLPLLIGAVTGFGIASVIYSVTLLSFVKTIMRNNIDQTYLSQSLERCHNNIGKNATLTEQEDEPLFDEEPLLTEEQVDELTHDTREGVQKFL